MKKLLAMLLVVAMLLTSLVACTPADQPEQGGNESSSAPAESSSTPAGGEESSKPADSSEEEIVSDLPDVNLGGQTVVIISRNDPWMKDEVSVEKTNGDPINDAIFQRNLNVESALDVTLENFMVTGNDYCVIDALKTTASDPNCPYQIAASSAYTCFENTAAGLFHNIYDVGHVDLSKSYWSPKYNEEASIGNAQYFVTGAVSLSLRRFIFATFFNKDLASDYGLEDLYAVVNDGRWTIEYQTGIIGNMFQELDGVEGQSEGDFYGFLSDDQIFIDPYIASCDVKLLVKDEENYVKLDPETEKLDNMMRMVNDLFHRSGASYIFKRDGQYSQFTKILQKFSSGEAVMVSHRIYAAESEELRSMESEYGIIPIPKYDEDQKEYYSLAHDLFTVYGVVSSVNSIDLDNVGAVLEAMAIESHKVVTPAYYEVALKGKYAKDPQSWDMLDMIVNNLKINGGLLYTINLNDITQKIRNMIRDDQSNASATLLSSISLKGLERSLGNMLKAIKEAQSE